MDPFQEGEFSVKESITIRFRKYAGKAWRKISEYVILFLKTDYPTLFHERRLL